MHIIWWTRDAKNWCCNLMHRRVINQGNDDWSRRNRSEKPGDAALVRVRYLALYTHCPAHTRIFCFHYARLYPRLHRRGRGDQPPPTQVQEGPGASHVPGLVHVHGRLSLVLSAPTVFDEVRLVWTANTMRDSMVCLPGSCVCVCVRGDNKRRKKWPLLPENIGVPTGNQECAKTKRRRHAWTHV